MLFKRNAKCRQRNTIIVAYHAKNQNKIKFFIHFLLLETEEWWKASSIGQNTAKCIDFGLTYHTMTIVHNSIRVIASNPKYKEFLHTGRRKVILAEK